jgi:hypothetical protein
MNIFYGDCNGRADVSGDAPAPVTLDTALEIFRGLDQRSGFMGINLDERFVVQFAPQKGGGIRIELLDTSGPACHACVVNAEFAESLIRAAADGRDVFQLARGSTYKWDRAG